MEPEHTHHEDLEIQHEIKSAFEMDLDHREDHHHMLHSNQIDYRPMDHHNYHDRPAHHYSDRHYSAPHHDDNVHRYEHGDYVYEDRRLTPEHDDYHHGESYD